MFLGILSKAYQNNLLEILAHSSLIVGHLAQKYLFSSAHKFSIGQR